MKLAKYITFTSFAFVVAISAGGTAWANDAGESLRIEKQHDTHSVNASPLGLLLGYYSLNYEYLIDGRHGFLVEGTYASYDVDNESVGSYGAGIGYRWHWSGGQDSGFLGVSAGFGVGSSLIRTDVLSDMSESHNIDIRSLYLTGNIGRRWAWDSGFNITLRVGAGYGDYEASTDSMSPEAQQQAADLQEQLAPLKVAFDGELSLGYTF